MLVAFSGWGIQSKNTNVLILIHFQKISARFGLLMTH